MTKIQQVYIDNFMSYLETHKYRFNKLNTPEEFKEVLHKIIEEVIY